MGFLFERRRRHNFSASYFSFFFSFFSFFPFLFFPSFSLTVTAHSSFQNLRLVAVDGVNYVQVRR